MKNRDWLSHLLILFLIPLFAGGVALSIPSAEAQGEPTRGLSDGSGSDDDSDDDSGEGSARRPSGDGEGNYEDIWTMYYDENNPPSGYSRAEIARAYDAIMRKHFKVKAAKKKLDDAKSDRCSGVFNRKWNPFNKCTSKKEIADLEEKLEEAEEAKREAEQALLAMNPDCNASEEGCSKLELPPSSQLDLFYGDLVSIGSVTVDGNTTSSREVNIAYHEADDNSRHCNDCVQYNQREKSTAETIFDGLIGLGSRVAVPLTLGIKGLNTQKDMNRRHYQTCERLWGQVTAASVDTGSPLPDGPVGCGRYSHPGGGVFSGVGGILAAAMGPSFTGGFSPGYLGAHMGGLNGIGLRAGMLGYPGRFGGAGPHFSAGVFGPGIGGSIYGPGIGANFGVPGFGGSFGMPPYAMGQGAGYPFSLGVGGFPSPFGSPLYAGLGFGSPFGMGAHGAFPYGVGRGGAGGPGPWAGGWAGQGRWGMPGHFRSNFGFPGTQHPLGMGWQNPYFHGGGNAGLNYYNPGMNQWYQNRGNMNGPLYRQYQTAVQGQSQAMANYYSSGQQINSAFRRAHEAQRELDAIIRQQQSLAGGSYYYDPYGASNPYGRRQNYRRRPPGPQPFVGP
jgi:hypothetical protein